MIHEDSIEVLLNYFKSLIPLNKKEKELVKQKFHYRLHRRRQYVLQEGDVCKHYHFVVKGCLRMYKIDTQGNTHILKFASENDWITEINSFYSLETTALNIAADTVWYEGVQEALDQHKPEIIVVNGGDNQFAQGGSVIMGKNDIYEVYKAAPNVKMTLMEEWVKMNRKTFLG